MRYFIRDNNKPSELRTAEVPSSDPVTMLKAGIEATWALMRYTGSESMTLLRPASPRDTPATGMIREATITFTMHDDGCEVCGSMLLDGQQVCGRCDAVLALGDKDR